MSNLVNMYPYTNFHDVNLDYIIKLVRENEGLYLETVGNLLVAKNAAGAIVSSVTIPYATTAGSADTAASANYAATAGTAATATHAATADTATSATTATDATHAATADSATTANTANSAASATYATSAGSATNATNAVNAQTAEYATTAGTVEHVENAIEDATTWTSFLRFIKGNGEDIMVQAPFSKAAAKDNLGNVIDATYVASVVNDNGVLKFKNANGAVIASVTPSSQSATEDDYGNLIASYIKAITAGSNYLTVTHGDGTTETLTIKYSEAAWKDTNGNVIKNFYAGSMECVEDDQTGHYNLVVYNGDTPKAELYRFEIYAYKAQEADHATTADTANSATTATNADRAASAATSDTSAYFIDCYDNNDNGYSIDAPNTIGVDGFYDNAGNSIPLTAITSEDWHNVYFRLRPSQNATYHYTYKVDTTYKVGSPTSPVFFKSRIIDGLQRDNAVDEITFENIEIGILNGAVATSKLFTYTATLTPST